jgi:transcriptional regulator with XRE-family HTH domain
MKLEVPTTDLVKVIGNRVRRVRTSYGLTQELLADRAGIHYTQVQRLEQGKANPTLETLVHLANALSLSVPEMVAPEHSTEASLDRLVSLLGNRHIADIELIMSIIGAVLQRLDQRSMNDPPD